MAEPVFRIVVDSHEPARAEELLASRGYHVERRRLRTGDYVVRQPQPRSAAARTTEPAGVAMA